MIKSDGNKLAMDYAGKEELIRITLRKAYRVRNALWSLVIDFRCTFSLGIRLAKDTKRNGKLLVMKSFILFQHFI